MNPSDSSTVADSIDVRQVLRSVFNKRDPNDDEIYVGISGADFPNDHYDLGNGLTIKPTYAHVFAPYLAAFKKPSETGAHHPPPWKTVGGGFAFDITTELHVPIEFETNEWFDRLNSAWWIVFLLRLKATPFLVAPVASNFSFSQIGTLDLEATFTPIEFNKRRSLLPSDFSRPVSLDDLNWIRSVWLTSGKLMRESDSFAHACVALDRSIQETDLSLALVTVWGGLERLFADFKSELNYRIALNIASFLEPDGKQRLDLFKSIRTLYGARSKAAHGGQNKDSDVFTESYKVLRSAILKVISQNHVPTSDEIERLVFYAFDRERRTE